MKNTPHTFAFAAVLGIVCSLLLAGVDHFTRPYREANERAEKVRNFLSALGATVDRNAGAAVLLRYFDDYVRADERGGLEVFVYTPADADAPAALAVPFAGPGVWGPIEGVLALEPDLRTVRGVRFYRQEETPGLGGEIASSGFLNQFPGKSIVSDAGEPGFRLVRPGTFSGRNSVDAITGATMTSERVEEMLDRTAKRLGGAAD